jgi:hypothetical protein
VARQGDTTINWVEGDGGEKHNNYFAFEPVACSEQTPADLTQRHNNQQQK